MPFVSILRRIFGWPNITIKYRGHWRVMMNAHPDILRLIDDTPDGETYRCAIADWSHSERPVIDYFRGITLAEDYDLGGLSCFSRCDFCRSRMGWHGQECRKCQNCG
jgi:hypothetical protein